MSPVFLCMHQAVHANTDVLMWWALPALLYTVCRFTQAPHILRSTARWTRAEMPFDVQGKPIRLNETFTADLSKLLIHHPFCRGGAVLKRVSHKYQWLAIQTGNSITQLSLITLSEAAQGLRSSIHWFEALMKIWCKVRKYISQDGRRI